VDPALTAVFSGNAHPKLAHDIARYLQMPLARAQVGRFSDGEINVEILENIRGKECFLVQPTCPPIIPYFGFARQDRRPRSSRVPITAKLVAKLIETAGVDRVLTLDLHADQIQGFFDIAVDNVYASPILLGDVWRQKFENMVVVSPDVGGVVRARALAKRLGDADLVIIDKRRQQANQSEVMNIIGECDGMNCIMMDDMVDTAGTLCHAAIALKENGAASVHAYITHAVLSGPAVARIRDSKLDTVVVTDTIPLSAEAEACANIRQLSTAELLGETMRRISDGESVSSLYVD
jgi:ribose-phosphate pyrophosphokinase